MRNNIICVLTVQFFSWIFKKIVPISCYTASRTRTLSQSLLTGPSSILINYSRLGFSKCNKIFDCTHFHFQKNMFILSKASFPPCSVQFPYKKKNKVEFLLQINGSDPYLSGTRSPLTGPEIHSKTFT